MKTKEELHSLVANIRANGQCWGFNTLTQFQKDTHAAGENAGRSKWQLGQKVIDGIVQDTRRETLEEALKICREQIELVKAPYILQAYETVKFTLESLIDKPKEIEKESADYLTECDLCHNAFPQRDVELVGVQMLCAKCRGPRQQ